ncbi:MAG: hypothetical protein FWF42_02805 [Streptococcaceae bacterium]|nr:hypothetical protein [Streptococcaceae bacterium]
MDLVKRIIAKQDLKDGIIDNTKVEVSPVRYMEERLPKGKYEYKFFFENDILTWYPFLNRSTHIEVAKEDILELDFGWGILENWVRDRGLEWGESDFFPHAANSSINGPAMPFSREAEGGWINIQLKDTLSTSHWVDAPQDWIQSKNAEIVGGQPLLVMNGFDVSFKDLKALGLTLSERWDIPVKYISKEVDWF